MFSYRHLKPALIAATLCVTALFSDHSHGGNVLRIAAVVNDEVITQQDLAERVKLTIATTRIPNTPEMRQRVAHELLRRMVDERLKAQQAEELEIKISDDKVENGVLTWARSVGIDPTKIDAALNSINVDKEVLKDQAYAELAWAQAVKQLGRERLTVSDREVDQTLAEQEANKGKPEYLYSEIFLPVNSPAQDVQAKQMAERLIGHIRAGSVFAALARDFSQSASAIRGGDLGWVQSGAIDARLEQALQAMPVGSVTPPIRIASGYMILQLRDKRISGEEENDEILSIAQIIYPMPEDAPQDQWAARQGLIRTLLMQATSCQNLVELGKQQGAAQSGQADNVPLSKLPAEIKNALADIKKDQSTILNQNDKALIGFRVCDRQAVTATPKVVIERNIRNQLSQEKFALEENRLLKKLRRKAFVDIRI